MKLNRYLRLLNPITVSRDISWRYLSGKSSGPHVFVMGTAIDRYFRLLTLKRCLRLLNPITVSKNISWWYLSGKSSEPHVFVMGTARSGTTLMFTVIKSHPAFSAVDEETFYFMPRDIFNDGYDRFSYAGGVSRQEYTRLRKKSKDIVNFYDNLAQFILERDGTRRFVEKTPYHTFRLRFLVEHFPNARFIFMIRDVRDCYVSHKQLETHLHADARDFACVWSKMIKIRQSLGKHPQIMDVSYESFTQKPLEAMESVMNFLGETLESQQIEPQVYSNTLLKATEGHDRLSQPITSATVGKWREKMTDEEISIVNQVAGKELIALGYEAN